MTETNFLPHLTGSFSKPAAEKPTVEMNQAIARGGEPNVIADAQQALGDGDILRATGALFKDAVNKYKDALAKAESA